MAGIGGMFKGLLYNSRENEEEEEVYEEDFYGDDYEDNDDYSNNRSNSGRSSYFDDDADDYEEARPRQRITSDNKVVSIHTTAQLQVVISKPTVFTEARDIANQLIEKRTVILNLEQAEKNVSRRIVDFLSGVAYANNGQIKPIANSTYIITPFNVGLTGADVLDSLENSGVYF